jgi:hypothetical protein
VNKYNFPSDTEKIDLDLNNKEGFKFPYLISTQADQTFAVIAAIVKFNPGKGSTEVVLVTHTAGDMSTRRLTAGSSEEGEIPDKTLVRKINFLTGLTPKEWVFISKQSVPNSSRDPERMNEVHYKLGAIVLDFTGTMLTQPPVNGETSAPYWVEIKNPGRLFNKHKSHLDNVVVFLKKHYHDKFPDL